MKLNRSHLALFNEGNSPYVFKYFSINLDSNPPGFSVKIIRNISTHLLAAGTAFVIPAPQYPGSSLPFSLSHES
jgi:hypothetical protein